MIRSKVLDKGLSSMDFKCIPLLLPHYILCEMSRKESLAFIICQSFHYGKLNSSYVTIPIKDLPVVSMKSYYRGWMQ